MQDVAFTDQRAVSDEDFFAQLSLPGQAGRGLQAARATGDRDEATRVVAGHFRTRSAPRWPFYMHGTAWLEIDGRSCVREKADALLHDRFRDSWPSFQWAELGDGQGHVDWHRGWTEMGTSISRDSFVTELSTAFDLTGNTQYLTKALQLVRSQVEAMPFVLEPGFFDDHDRYFGGESHNCLATIYRLLRWIDFYYCGAFQVPGLFSDQDLVWLLKQIWFLSRQHYRLVGDVDRRDNHHLVSHGHGPYALGMMFREFAVSQKMVAAGKRVIAFHFAHNILEDGGYAEHSTKYQYHILFHYLGPQAIAQANGIKLLNPAQLKRLARWVALSLNACKPDGILCEFGDEYGGSLAYLFGTLAVPVMSPELAAAGRALGYEPGKLTFQTQAGLARRFKQWQPGQPPRVGLSPYYAHGKPPGKPAAAALPKPATHQYPKGGYTFFRSAWNKAADFLAVSHFTGDYVGHSHWDPMSFVLHTQGKTLIGDPATVIYDDKAKFWNKEREYRGYHYNMESHNCLVMDDDNMKSLKAMCHRCYWGGPQPRHALGLFEAGGPIEVAEMWHDGYAPTRHRRFVVHVRGVGFALLDLIRRQGQDSKPRQYSQLLHFEGGVDVDAPPPAAGAPLRARAGDAACWIVPGADTQSVWKLWRDPYLENMSGASIAPPAPWVAELTRYIQGPAAYANFLITHSFSDGHSPSARYLGPRPAQADHPQHDGFSANRIDLGPHGILLLASAPYGKSVQTPDIETDAEMAAAHLDAHGKVLSWVLARGSRLRIGDKALVNGKKREWVAG